MITVKTKEELAAALSKGETALVVGKLAETMRKNAKRKKVAKWTGGAIVAASLAALPLTGGASAFGVAAGGAMLGGTMALTAGQLAILVGGAIALVGVLNGCKVSFNSDGSVTVEPQK